MQKRLTGGLFLALGLMGAAIGCGGSADFGTLGDHDASRMSVPDGGTVVLGEGDDTPEAAAMCDSATHCMTSAPRCQSRSDCASSPDGPVCDTSSGKCVGCVAQADCLANNDCVGEICKPYTTCKSSLECGKGQVCSTDLGRCVECVGTGDCAADQICAGNGCRQKCASDTQCTKLGLLCDTTRGACVACVGATDCKTEEYCREGTCVHDVCAAASSSCEANAVVTCRSDGSGFGGPVPCDAQQTCVAVQGAASCKDKICTPSVVACDPQSEKVIQCSTDGLSSATKIDCATTNQVCIAAACAPVVCQAGKAYCQAGVVRKCSAKGDVSTVVQACTAGQFCDGVSATCKPQICAPNLPACNLKIATTCNADGSGYVMGGIDCGTKNCSGGACVECAVASEVAYNGHCYYLDGSSGCDAGYAKAPESVLTNIAAGFAGKTYKHAVSGNCCVDTADAVEHWGMVGHCNAPGPFSVGEPALGGSGCAMAVQHVPLTQLTLCGSL